MMGVKLTWFAHSAFMMEVDNQTILIDPFLSGNPLATVKADSLNPDFIILTHGHGDHVGDTVEIARRTGATVISNLEVANWVSDQGVESTVGLNTGGGKDFGFGRVELTIAFHSSSMPDGSYGGMPNGVLIFAPDVTIYHAGDTALFSDMQHIGRKNVDVAMLPIGDFFTMGPDDSVEAVKYIKPTYVLPMHYNTFPPIQQDASSWAQRIHTETKASAIVLDPGGSYEFGT
jgi:L-ascorbate metabolism protein UlaG (beta-lactamase superfamily)